MSVIEVIAVPSIPEEATRFGFRIGARGTHSSRTLMLREIAQLLDAVRPDADHDTYVHAIREDNVLGKRTAATREQTAQRLTELYALDPGVTLFRVLRRMWRSESEGGRPLLALLCALARDPLLRATAVPVLDLAPGDELPRQLVVAFLREAVESRMNDETLDKVVRNAASSWTQTGHLQGRVFKRRQRIAPTPLALVYALVLGYLLGNRGAPLLKTFWTRALDAGEDLALSLAMDARRFGVVDIKHGGAVTEVRFPRGLLTRDELEAGHGPY